MPIRNVHWTNLNEGLSYPIDDTATCLDNDGVHLPSNILVDLQLRFPDSLGRYAFISAVSVTARLVTVTIQATDDLDGTGFQPLAVFSGRLPIVEGRQLALNPQTPGVGGWISFGSGANDNKLYQGRFGTARQSLLTPRAARSYRSLPVSGIRQQNANPALQGVVRLRAQPPLQVVSEERDVDGQLRDVIVIRLLQEDGGSGVPDSNVFQQFAGPCAGRPDSRSCDPPPIEFINTVAPDCDGQITLELKGCAVAAHIQDPCGIAIACSQGLADACLASKLPDDTGSLPDEATVSDLDVTSTPGADGPGDATSEPDQGGGELPYLECFDGSVAANFQVQIGAFTFVTDDSPSTVCHGGSITSSISDATWKSYATNSAAGRNVSIWDGFDVITVHRQVSTEVKLVAGPAGAKHNGGLVLNYKPHPFTGGQFVYFAVVIDYDLQEFQVLRFNGLTFVTVASVSVPGIILGHWYRLTAAIVPGDNSNQTRLTATLEGIDDPAVQTTIGPFVTAQYAPSDGHFGLGSDRALAYFSYFRVEHLD